MNNPDPKPSGRPGIRGAFSMKSAGHKVLALSTVLHPDSHQLQSLYRAFAAVKNREAILSRSRHEGVAALLYQNLIKSGAVHLLGSRQKWLLQSIYHETLRFNLRRIHDLKAVLDAAGRENIPIVLMQGVALLLTLYPDPGVRPMTDMDLWVPPSAYPRLAEMLRRIGYTRDPHYPGTFRNGRTILDIHTHVLWADRITARNGILSSDPDRIFRRTQTVTLDGLNARCLNPYDLVLYLGLHAVKHNVGRLIWLADIRNLLAGFSFSDWTLLKQYASDLGQTESLDFILMLLTHLTEFDPPQTAFRFRGIGHPHPLYRHAVRFRVKKGHVPFWVRLYLFTSGMSWQKRVRFILETLFPRPEILRQIFKDRRDSKAWRLYGRRVVQLIGKLIH